MQAEDALHQIVDVTKTARLGARSENGQVLSPQRLSNEGRQHTSVIQAHPRSVRVEDPHNPRFHTVVAVVGHRHGFLESLGFVIDASRSDGVHVAEVLLMLRVHLWIAIDLAGRSDGDPGSFVLGQTQAIVDSLKIQLSRSGLESGGSQWATRATRNAECDRARLPFRCAP